MHIRRLLDIVACTNSFGPSGKGSLDTLTVKNNNPHKRGSYVKSSDATTTRLTTSICEDRNASSELTDSTDCCAKALKENPESGPEHNIVQEIALDDTNKTCEESVKLDSMKSTKPEAAAAMAAAKEATDRGDMTGMCPPSRLSQFYEFFSLSHMTSPFLCK